MHRRNFLGWTGTAGALLAAHSFAAEEETGPVAAPNRRLAGEVRIRRLELASAAPLAQIKTFYREQLGLHLVDETPSRLTIDAGQTQLTFAKSTAGGEPPFYHFAFNIPENKILAAHRWQKERTPLLPIPAHLRDPSLPADVVHYRHWNAHSIFFFDPAGNVVEYIARHDLRNAASGEFSCNDILYASEIAFVTDDVPAMATRLKELAGSAAYKGESDQFVAIGDENGLLLVMKRGRVISFNSPQQKAVSVFPTLAAIRAARPGQHAFPEFPYQVIVES